MKKVTQKDYQSFIQIYKGLPERSAVKAPKTEFVEEIAALCIVVPRRCECGFMAYKSRMPSSKR